MIMSNRIDPQHHKDINELIAENKQKEQQAKLDEELKRQKALITDSLIPFLNNISITSAKVLINNSLKTLSRLFEQKMKEEQQRLSVSTIIQLDILERMERSEAMQMQRSLVEKLKDENIGAASGILTGLHALIAGTEAQENDKRNLDTLKLEI